MAVNNGVCYLNITNATKNKLYLENQKLKWGTYHNSWKPKSIIAPGNTNLIMIQGGFTSGCEVELGYIFSEFLHPRPCRFKIFSETNYDGTQYCRLDPMYGSNSCFGEFFYAKVRTSRNGIVWNQNIEIYEK